MGTRGERVKAKEGKRTKRNENNDMESNREKLGQKIENKNASVIHTMMLAFRELLLRIQSVSDVMQDNGRQRVKPRRYGSLSSKNLQSS